VNGDRQRMTARTDLRPPLYFFRTISARIKAARQGSEGEKKWPKVQHWKDKMQFSTKRCIP
jgi:hypothetical protein